MKSQKIHNFSRTKDIATVEHALRAIEMKEFITFVLCVTIVALVNTDTVPSITNPHQIAANSYTSQ